MEAPIAHRHVVRRRGNFATCPRLNAARVETWEAPVLPRGAQGAKRP